MSDGKPHSLNVIIAGNLVTLFIDGVQNAVIQANNAKLNQSKTEALRPLVMQRPIYVGGGPRNILESEKLSTRITESVGITGNQFSVENALTREHYSRALF